MTHSILLHRHNGRPLDEVIRGLMALTAGSRLPTYSSHSSCIISTIGHCHLLKGHLDIAVSFIVIDTFMCNR